MAPKRRISRVVRGLALLAALALPAGAGALEAKVFAIGDFKPSSSGGCGGNDISHWPVMVDEWYDHMAVHGHQKDGQYTNGNMTVQRFCDPDHISTSCRDYLYVDEADASMIATHGYDNGDHWGGIQRWKWNGQCTLDGGGSAHDLHVGDVDLEFIHLSSCNSADDDNLSGIRHALTDPVDGGYAHQWNGFHGVMWIGGGFDNDYEDFAHDAHYGSMASAWVSNHHRNNSVDCEAYDPWNWFGTCQDQCPVAVAIGPTASSALTRLHYERYNNVFSDPTNNNWYAYMYMSGCNPVGENTWNP